MALEEKTWLHLIVLYKLDLKFLNYILGLSLLKLLCQIAHTIHQSEQ